MVVDMGRRYVRWAVAHPDYYQVMFGAETKDKADHPGLLIAGAQAFGALLQAVMVCQTSGAIKGDDPLPIAGPLWSMIHGVASLAIGGDLHHVGIGERSRGPGSPRDQRSVRRTRTLGDLRPPSVNLATLDLGPASDSRSMSRCWRPRPS